MALGSKRRNRRTSSSVPVDRRDFQEGVRPPQLAASFISGLGIVIGRARLHGALKFGGRAPHEMSGICFGDAVRVDAGIARNLAITGLVSISVSPMVSLPEVSNSRTQPRFNARMILMRANIVGPSRAATSNSACTAACHSSASCSVVFYALGTAQRLPDAGTEELYCKIKDSLLQRPAVQCSTFLRKIWISNSEIGTFRKFYTVSLTSAFEAKADIPH